VLAVYPGSFDPPTIAHLALARAALVHVDEVRLVLSEVALGKEDLSARTPVHARLEVLHALAATTHGLSAGLTSARLVADIAEALEADAVVMGADKWAQVVDPAWYGGSSAARDAALRRLPTVLLAHRPGSVVAPVPGVEVVDLGVDPIHAEVSATRARAGEAHLMVDAARASGLWG
jgi:hypothetical protein